MIVSVKEYKLETIEINGIQLSYEVRKKGICIKESSGRGSLITIPESVLVDGTEIKVTEIGKKAFLGNKSLREVILPKTIVEIDDWAFSQCAHLRKIVVPALFDRSPGNRFNLGRRVFEGCSELTQMCADKDENGPLSYLCAALVSRLPAEYLLWDDDIGSRHWYEKWDLALTGFILRKDNEGYTDTVLCGEEDISYDGIGSVDGELLGETYEYVKKVSKNKSFLCLLRLVHDVMMDDAARDVYCRYITNHKRGVGNEAAWLALVEDVGDELEFYKAYSLVAESSAEELSQMIAQMGEDKAQAKAYLISLRPKEDAFGLFDL